jgi:hypothetical protein
MNLARLVTSYLRRKASYDMPAQIPSSLAAIDPKVDPKGWAAELIQVIKKAFNLKGMVGKVKPTINKTGFIIDFTKYDVMFGGPRNRGEVSTRKRIAIAYA